MKWAIVLVIVAGVDGKPTAIETIPSQQVFSALEKCRTRATELNAYSELPPIDNGIISQFYRCVAR